MARARPPVSVWRFFQVLLYLGVAAGIAAAVLARSRGASFAPWVIIVGAPVVVEAVLLARYAGYRHVRPILRLHPLVPPASAFRPRLTVPSKGRLVLGWAFLALAVATAGLALLPIPKTGQEYIAPILLFCGGVGILNLVANDRSLEFRPDGLRITPFLGRPFVVPWRDLERAVAFQSAVTTDVALRLELRPPARRRRRISLMGYPLPAAVRQAAAGFTKYGVPCFWEDRFDNPPGAHLGGRTDAAAEPPSMAS